MTGRLARRPIVLGLSSLVVLVVALSQLTARHPAEVVTVELSGYRALRVERDRKVYVFTPDDVPRVRVVCLPSAPTCADRLAIDLDGDTRTPRDRTVRGDGTVLHLEPLPARGTALTAGGQRFAVEVFVPAPAVDDAAVITARIASPQTSPLDRLDAMKALARTEARQGRVELYRQTQEARAAEALATGYVSEASDAWTASAYFAYRARDFAAMTALLDRARALDDRESFALGRVRGDLVRGYAAIELGRYREALRILEDAAERAWIHGHDEDREWVEKALAPLYLELGQPERALAQLARLEPRFRAKDERARLAFAVDLAWIELECVARGAGSDLATPRARLEEALASARRLEAREDEATILTNLLWADQLAGDRAGAEIHQAALARLPEEVQGFGRLLALIVEGHFALAAGDPARAAASFDAVIARAEREHASPSPYLWRALYGRARAGWAQGDGAGARRDFLAAQDALETLALQADLQTSRARFLEDADQLRADAVRFFLEAGALADAFLAAERGRTQLLLSLELQVRSERLSEDVRRALDTHRQAYLELRSQLTARVPERKRVAGSELAGFDARTTELAAAASQQLHALYAQLDREAPVLTGRLGTVEALWDALPPGAELISFARSGSSTIAFVLGAQSIRVASLGPDLAAAARTAGTGHLYLVAGTVSVERLAREVLPAILPLRTASILPYAGALLPAAHGAVEGAPLVVADPGGDLPHARREGRRVAEALGEAQVLSGAAATERAVREALARAPLFHFAGHGLLSPVEPWQSRLELSDGALSLENVLVTAPPSRTVVLSGCETGRGARWGRELSIGLPEAFVLAGADSVVATIERVGDEDAARFIEQFYAEGGAQHPARAFQSAFLSALGRGSAARSFYLMGRAHEG